MPESSPVASRPTVVDYDYHPCECGSERFEAVTREVLTVTVHGHEDDTGVYVPTERNFNRQGPERLVRLTCADCGRVLEPGPDEVGNHGDGDVNLGPDADAGVETHTTDVVDDCPDASDAPDRDG